MLDVFLPVAYSDFTTFWLAIDKVDQGRVLVIQRIAPDSNKELRLSLNSSSFGPGEYRIRLQGYAWNGEYGLTDRRYCTRDDLATGRRLVQAHFYADGDPSIERHLAFRDYLNAHPAIAQGYAADEQRCRALHPDNSHHYSRCKYAWIEPVEAAALAWARGGR